MAHTIYLQETINIIDKFSGNGKKHFYLMLFSIFLPLANNIAVSDAVIF